MRNGVCGTKDSHSAFTPQTRTRGHFARCCCNRAPPARPSRSHWRFTSSALRSKNRSSVSTDNTSSPLTEEPRYLCIASSRCSALSACLSLLRRAPAAAPPVRDGKVLRFCPQTVKQSKRKTNLLFDYTNKRRQNGAFVSSVLAARRRDQARPERRVWGATSGRQKQEVEPNDSLQ